MRRLPRHSRRWSPAVLRSVCMNGKIVPSRGPIHYLLGNDYKKGPVLHTPAAYSNIPLITFQVIASPVATHHFRTSHPKEVVATNLVPMSRLLRLALLADAVASGATAALLVAGAGYLEGWLGLSVAMMREAGMVLIPYVTFVAFVAVRPAVPVNAVNAIIGIHAAWTAASSLLLVSGWVTPTLLGIAFVLAQAFAVGAFGVIQYLCLQHSSSAATG